MTLVKEWLWFWVHYPAVKFRSKDGNKPIGLILNHILESIGGCLEGIHPTNGLMVSMFLAGIVSGFTHCMAMCGPFVISQTKNIEKISDAALLPYHLGRLTTYVVLAALLYSVLNIVFLFAPVRSLIIAPILMVAGLIFLINAFPKLMKFFIWADVVKIALPYRYVSKIFQKLSVQPNGFKKYAMGVILGFMPCGMVTSALMASATAPHIFDAALSMAAFGLGTVPALVVTAATGQALKVRYPHMMPMVTRGMMIWSGAWLFIMAGLILI